MSWFRRTGTDPDGWPIRTDQFGRTPAEAAEEEQEMYAQAWRLSNRTLMENFPYLGIRQIGVDPDGWPVYGRPF